MKKLISVLVLLLYMNTHRAQNLYGINQPTVGMNYLSVINPATGSITLISPSRIAQNIYSKTSTLDQVNNRFLFLSSGDTLHATSLTSGADIFKNRLSLPYTNVLIEFDEQDTTLYSLTGDTATNMYYLSKINPATGSVTIISSLGLCKRSSLNLGISSLDPMNKRLFFITSNDSIYCVSLVTGAVISKNILSTGASVTIPDLEFNCQDTVLYAISQSTTSNDNYLCRINPLTGSLTIISPSALAKSTNVGVCSLDPLNGRFFFLTSGDTLSSVSLTSGLTLNKNKLVAASGSLIALIEFEKQCSAISTGLKTYLTNKNNILIFPNPNTGNFKLRTDEKTSKSTLVIFNYLGQKVLEQKIDDETLETNIALQDKGVYTYILIQSGQKIDNGKLIIE